MIDIDKLAEAYYAKYSPEFIDEREGERQALRERIERFELEWDDDDPDVIDWSMAQAIELIKEAEVLGVEHYEIDDQIYEYERNKK